MSKKKNKASKKKSEKKAKGPEVELTPEQQSEQIGAALDQAVAAGIPSAGEIKAMFMLAETFWNSGMFKSAGSPAGCFVTMLYGREKGLKMMEAMTNIVIIDGSPAMSSQLMAAKFKEAGGKIKWLERSVNAARVKLTWKGKSQVFSFTEEL